MAYIKLTKYNSTPVLVNMDAFPIMEQARYEVLVHI